jgi:flagellar motor component MotA
VTHYLGIAICLFIVGGALFQIGPHLYMDINSLLFVLGGGVGYALITGGKGRHVTQFCTGAVYFGWLGTLVGLIAMAAGAFDNWGDLDRMGPALAVAMLTLFYGYMVKLISLAFADRS